MNVSMIQRISLLGLMVGALGAALPESAEAQLKPSTDPQIHAYVRTPATLTGSLTIVGSETMKPLVQRWENQLKEIYPHVDIKIQSAGSETGLPALLEGKAQIAALSRKLTSQEIEEYMKRHGYKPTEVPVAQDALAVFVHRDNPITGLTFKELDAMFCKERRRGADQPITKWGQLGLDGEWNRADIWLHGRTAASGTATHFLDQVCLNGTFNSTVVEEPGSASVVAEVMKDRYAIGFSGIGYKTSTVRAVPLAERQENAFIEATFETAINGTYPLERKLYLYVDKPAKGELPPIVSEFVKFATSHEGQELVVKQGFFPLPTEELNRYSAAWSHPVQTAGDFPSSRK
jgi:phosphate transport system substrate-binding protein